MPVKHNKYGGRSKICISKKDSKGNWVCLRLEQKQLLNYSGDSLEWLLYLLLLMPIIPTSPQRSLQCSELLPPLSAWRGEGRLCQQ